MTTNTTAETRIYVASLADYNAGTLHGRWIDADQDPEAIQAEVDAMLAESKQPDAEEWAIHDYELAGIDIGEWESFETVAKLAEAVTKHGEAFAVWHNYQPEYNTDPERFEAEYLGTYESEEDYAAEYWEQIHDMNSIPAELRFAIDWEQVARDMEPNGAVLFLDDSLGEVHVFDPNA